MLYDDSLNILKEFLKIPSVAATGLKSKPMRQAGDFLLKLFRNCGFEVFSDTFEDNRIIYAEYLAESQPLSLTGSRPLRDPEGIGIRC
ncbi:MAG: hypothetical protein QME51_10240, partial [Planctomycetota bacterium]|nr:hypothetical protein [Planctomycetota bacterium]